MVKKRMTSSDIWISIVIGTLLTLFCVVIIYPLYYMFIVSISSGNAVIRGEVKLLPMSPNVKSYLAIFKDKYILRSYLNTLLYTSTGTLVNVSMSALCAYPLSRRYFYGRNLFTVIIIFTMLFDAGIVSNFLVVQRLGLINSIWAIILPPAISVYNMIIIRTFFQNLPEEMYESAYIDGADDFTTFFRIVLPLSKPVLATMVLFYAVAHWNSFLPALLYLDDRLRYPMQLIMRNIVINNELSSLKQSIASVSGDMTVIGTNIKYAVIFITVAPILVVYPFVQKHFAKGVMIGALKG